MARPGKVEIDALEELGNPGWNWETTLVYMKKVRTRPAFYFVSHASDCTHLFRLSYQSERFDPVKLSAEDATRYAAVPDPANHGTNGMTALHTSH